MFTLRTVVDGHQRLQLSVRWNISCEIPPSERHARLSLPRRKHNRLRLAVQRLWVVPAPPWPPNHCHISGSFQALRLAYVCPPSCPSHRRTSRHVLSVTPVNFTQKAVISTCCSPVYPSEVTWQDKFTRGILRWQQISVSSMTSNHGLQQRSPQFSII